MRRWAAALHPCCLASRLMNIIDPRVSSPTSWQSRMAAFISRDVPEDDPRVVECRRALSYWRVRRVLDAEVGVLGAHGVSAVDKVLLDLVAATS